MITFADRVYGEALNMLGSDPVDPALQGTLDHLHDLATASHQPAPLAVGDRVRTLIPLETDVRICGCDPAVCRDLPIGSLGTVTSVFAQSGRRYGVLLDDDNHQLACSLDAAEIERAV
jgi:hypothetical protein